MNRGLLTLRANVMLDPKALPDRVVVLPWGESKTRFGPVKVNEITLSALPSNQQGTNFDHVVIDFQHNTVKGTPAYAGEPAKVAVRKCLPKVIRGEGLVLEALEWTEDGRNHAVHYPDLSATVKTDKDGNVIFIHSAALCRQGEVEGITLPLSADPFNKQPSKENMDYKKLLCDLLGLSAESTDEQISTAAKTMGDKLKTLAAQPPAGDGKTVTLSAEEFKKLGDRLEAVEKGRTADEKQHMIDIAIRDGKLVTLNAEQIDKWGPEELKKHLDGLKPNEVPLDKRTPEKLKTLSASDVLQTNNADKEVASRLGITQEQWDKAHKK